MMSLLFFNTFIHFRLLVYVHAFAGKRRDIVQVHVQRTDKVFGKAAPPAPKLDAVVPWPK